MLKLAKNIAIGSVFIPGERTKTWYKLQIDFIKRTTKNFKHYVFLNGKDFDVSFDSSEIIGQSTEHALNVLYGTAQGENHLLGLNALLDHFRKIQAENYLILDCDCFPIRFNWSDILLESMNKKNKLMAAPIRTENLDVFPHPSALFFKKDALQKEWFDLSHGTTMNLMNHPIHDVGGKLPLKECFPLMRTNRFNAHPIFGAIYGHIFYHHTCGSRPKTLLTRGILMEQITSNYMGENHWEIEETIFKELIQSPDKLLNKLLGNYNDLQTIKSSMPG